MKRITKTLIAAVAIAMTGTGCATLESFDWGAAWDAVAGTVRTICGKTASSAAPAEPDASNSSNPSNP